MALNKVLYWWSKSEGGTGTSTGGWVLVFPVTRPPSHPCQHTTPPSISWPQIGSLFDVTGVLFSGWWNRVSCKYSTLISFDIYITWYITIWCKMQISEFTFKDIIKILLLYWLICGCFFPYQVQGTGKGDIWHWIPSLAGASDKYRSLDAARHGLVTFLYIEVQRKFSLIQQHPRWKPFQFSWWCWWWWWEWLLPRVTHFSWCISLSMYSNMLDYTIFSKCLCIGTVYENVHYSTICCDRVVRSWNQLETRLQQLLLY